MIGRAPAQVVEKEWIEFPGGELEGTRPRALCPVCREKVKAGLQPRTTKTKAKAPLCFQCYRAELDRERMVKAAGDLHTASEERVQTTQQFVPVQRPLRGRRRAGR